MTKVILLARVSSTTDRQDTERQITELRPFCESKGWEVIHIVRAKLSATSTKLEKRTDITELLSAVKTYKADKVVVTELSRIGRNAKDVHFVLKGLDGMQCSLFLKNIGIESISEETVGGIFSKVFLQLAIEFANLEVLQSSQRIKSGLQNAKEKGVRLGRPTGKKTEHDFEKKWPKLRKAVIENPALSLNSLSKLTGASPNTVKKMRDIIHAKPEG